MDADFDAISRRRRSELDYEQRAVGRPCRPLRLSPEPASFVGEVDLDVPKRRYFSGESPAARKAERLELPKRRVKPRLQDLPKRVDEGKAGGGVKLGGRMAPEERTAGLEDGGYK